MQIGLPSRAHHRLRDVELCSSSSISLSSATCTRARSALCSASGRRSHRHAQRALAPLSEGGPLRAYAPSLRPAGVHSPAIGIALMCIEFRGFASPYVPGVCLVLLGRTRDLARPLASRPRDDGHSGGVVLRGAVRSGRVLASPRLAAPRSGGDHDPSHQFRLRSQHVRVARHVRAHRVVAAQAGVRGA